MCLKCSVKFTSSCRLRPVDIEFMKALQDKVNVVPLIAKADCLTPSEIKKLKERVRRLIYSDTHLHYINNNPLTPDLTCRMYVTRCKVPFITQLYTLCIKKLELFTSLSVCAASLLAAWCSVFLIHISALNYTHKDFLTSVGI